MKSWLAEKFEGYSGASFRKDLLSGAVVGVIAIPLGMAFAIASGVKPEYGIYTTIVAGILVSLLGGSRFQIGGPTGAFIPVLLGIVLTYGYENLLIAGFMAGILLILMGAFRLGSLIRFIPRPVTVGFTAGIAVTIFSGQIANFLGLQGLTRHEDFLSNMKEIAVHLDTFNSCSVITAMLCLGVMLLARRKLPRVPGSLLGLIVSAGAAAWLYPAGLPTIGSTFGAIPGGLPRPDWPVLTGADMLRLLQPALVIAMLGGIESLLSAVVADGMTGTKHNSNRELVGQGIANMIIPLFGGIPATGAIARTAANIRNGAVSPLSGVVHGAVVLLILLLFAPYASRIPLASMAPILMVVAWDMSERRAFAHICRTRTSDAIIMILVFLLTVFINLTTAVEAGLLLAAVFFIKRMSVLHSVEKVLPDPNDGKQKVRAHAVHAGRDCPQISIYTIDGPLFFGSAQAFEQTLDGAAAASRPNWVLLRMGNVPYMDTTGAAILMGVVRRFRRAGVRILVTGVRPQPKQVLIKTGMYEEIGEERLRARTGEAINEALHGLDPDRCKGCRHYAFRECAALSGTSDPAAAAAPTSLRQGELA